MYPICRNHQDSTLQKNAEHLAAWRKYAASLQEERTQEVGELSGKLTAARRELAGRPESVVDRVMTLDEDVLIEARQRAADAYRSRTRAYEALCLIRLRH